MNCSGCGKELYLVGDRCVYCVAKENATLRLLVAHMVMSIESAHAEESPHGITYTQQYGQAFLEHLKMVLGFVKYQNGSSEKTFTLPFSKYCGVYLQLTSAFSQKMYAELAANDEAKGNFAAWSPSPAQAASELEHHVRKLKGVLEDPVISHSETDPVEYQKARITEFCADIANTAMGIERTLGLG